jgi:hypothetical protein|uniref:Uncharacterized protein n=1 Tax=viral metagenome TaxID=1070528 RepID=A0A6C0IJV9_9ZZZZ
MEKRVNNTIEDHMLEFKNVVCEKVMQELGETEQCSNIIQFIYEHKRLVLTTEDFSKRKRVKNDVPHCERCTAKRSNGEQCTRRKKDGELFCGTHIKGTPHGFISPDEQGSVQTTSKVEVWLQDFKGISYYIDNQMNVYQTEDIVSNKRNPKIISKYVTENGEYSIPNIV